MSRLVKNLLLVALYSALVACGGGGGSSKPNDGKTGGDNDTPVKDGGVANSGKIWKIARQGVEREMVDVAYTGERYLAISEEYNLTSTDGLNWSKILDSKNGVNFVYRPKRVEYLNSKLFTVGNFFSIKSSSDNGFTWKQSSPCSGLPCLGNLLAIAWSGTTYVAAGEEGKAYSSTDGENWSEVAMGLEDNETIYDMVYENGLFVAVGASITESLILTSTDGKTWTQIDVTAVNLINSIVWNGTEFVALGRSTVFKSTDGANWTETKTNRSVKSINWDGSNYYGICPVGHLCRSADAITWESVEQKQVVYSVNQLRLFKDQGQLIAAGEGIGSSHIATTKLSDLSQYQVGFSSWDFETVTADSQQFYALDRVCNFYTSANGKEWTYSHDYSTGLSNGCAGSDLLWIEPLKRFVMTDSASIMSSSNAKDWESHVGHTVGSLGHDAHAIVWTGQHVVAVGVKKDIYTATDGKDWQTVTVGSLLSSVAWSENLNMLVAVGRDGKILTSNDAITWTDRPDVTEDHLSDVVFFKDRFIATGANNLVMQSVDGINWDIQRFTLSNKYTLRNLIVSDDAVYLAWGFQMFRSTDGINWETESSENNLSLTDSVHSAFGTVAVGPRGTIIYRDGSVD